MLFSSASAADGKVAQTAISIVSLSPPRIRVEGQLADETTNWKFLKEYAGVSNLSDRIENLRVFTADNSVVPVRKLKPDEFESAGPASRFSYEVNLRPPASSVDAAHTSWLTAEYGALMLDDLLPQAVRHTCLRVAMPPDWKLHTSEPQSAGGCFDVRHTEKAMIWVGRQTREYQGRGRSISFTFITQGKWSFADEDLVHSISAILKEHESVAGATPFKHALVIVAPFPTPTDAHRWSAETRGNTVLLLSGNVAAKAAALSRLNLSLVHELFHLWVPNGLALSGNYDWFYEGFTNYQATRAATELGFLTFPEYLDALARAYDKYRAQIQTISHSLLAASDRRWRDAGTLVYHKGMIVAFLCDLDIRLRTKGKHSLSDVYRELLRRHSNGLQSQDGNNSVVQVLHSFAENSAKTKRYLASEDVIDLTTELSPYGLRVEKWGASTRIRVADSLQGAQYKLLRKIGYNGKDN
ncbi:MAG: hypothetical protein M3371_05275 [Acidobacteriota bacterium]|nr:hypothetical protein [Acidobacteriota bacterium]